jgi:SMI1 / KNR4 family (SUKH-1)
MPFPLNPQFVRAAEAKLGRSLPASYVAQMCRQNGGEVSVGEDVYTLYPIQDSSDSKRRARTCNDIIRETTKVNEWAGFPPDALAIGDNGCGDKLILLPDITGTKFADEVCWWDHETGKVHSVASSFDQLK